MTTFVDIKPGQWVLAWQPTAFLAGEHEMAEALEGLRFGGAGWTYVKAGDLFAVHQITKVMPKTYKAMPYADGTEDGSEVRDYRAAVIAASANWAEIIRLCDTLFAIGREADDAIEAEAARLIAPFEKATREAAVAKVRAALPHHFGGAA
ncbi:hypothetical protein [Mesorhizobium sp. YM1C-6-2]|uniref:hypothetical protein n=1 Tax=Mesorhizobium sp. YM1C-6-2 TaxID=1827501 RepID=UPI000EF1797A|nr:hypothetical protein [Mesorhizobium sp. YM1C-6-2]RLP22249.1 hypothetical protein D8676_25240 [Mesorhizobium sp. YM1C-6-2]